MLQTFLLQSHKGREKKSVAAINLWFYLQNRYVSNTEAEHIEEILADSELCQSEPSLLGSDQQFSKYDPVTPKSLRDLYGDPMRSNDFHCVAQTLFALLTPLLQVYGGVFRMPHGM